MSAPGSVGFFGKLPGMGDFVQRRLPGAFVSAWDTRFEAAVSAARADFGDTWRSLWQAAPVWRFALMPGVCGVQAWVGVTGPSVDRVGRSFPMVLAAPLTEAETFRRIVREGDAWFESLESACRGADATPTAESFDATVAAVPGPRDWLTDRAPAAADPADWSAAEVWRMPWRVDADDSRLAAWLEACMGANDGCLWWTHGGSRVPSSAVLTHGLPQPHDYPAFLDATRAPARWRTHGALAAPATHGFAQSHVPAPAKGATPLPDDLDDMLADLLPASAALPADAALGDVSASSNLLDDLVAPLPTATLAGNGDGVAHVALDDEDRTVVPVPDATAAAAPGVRPAFDDDEDRTVVPAPRTTGSAPAAPQAPVRAGVVFQQTDAVAVLAADNGPFDPRRQAAARAGDMLDELGSLADLPRWCERLRALHPALRERSEDLINPIPEDGAVLVVRVADGEAALLRIGAASAWHWRRGQLRSLFDDAAPVLPLDQADTARPDDLAGVLSSTRLATGPGLGTAGEPRCEEIRCLVAAGDRLVLLATDTLVRVPAQALAASLAAATGEEARAQIATAAGLGVDRQQWPVAVIEVGT